MWSIPVLLCVIVLGALGASFWVWTQRKNHSTDISRLQTGRTDEIDRLQRIHSDELSASRNGTCQSDFALANDN
jgi:hypothetical protein